MDDPIARIGRKIGASGKSLGPPLGEAEVAAFEARHGIALPEGYRRFLIEVGDGGDGPPSYGLARLGSGPSSFFRPETEYWERLPDVARPFPFTKMWIWEDGEVSDEGTLGQIWHGSLFLGTDGCGMNYHLIVTGPERGHVWSICGEGQGPELPRRDFLAWYEDWLEGRRGGDQGSSNPSTPDQSRS